MAEGDIRFLISLVNYGKMLDQSDMYLAGMKISSQGSMVVMIAYHAVPFMKRYIYTLPTCSLIYFNIFIVHRYHHQ
eukprot:c44281_g1_i1 orf=91-318(+)